MSATMVLLLLVFSLRQPTPEAKPSVFGARYDGLRLLCADRQLIPAATRDFFEADRDAWKQWIVIVLDDTRPLDEIGIQWDQFVQAGGALLVATDRTFDGGELGLLRASIAPGPVTVDPTAGYLGRATCPLVVDWNDKLGLCRGVKTVVANRAGWFSSQVPGWQTRARLHESARAPGAFIRAPLPFFAARQWDAGRIALMADQSVFSNEMLLEGDNCRFASNCIDWLSEGGKRQKVLFLEAGIAVDDWVDPRFEAGRWPQSDWDSLIALINEEIIPNLNRSDVINGLIQDLQSSIDPFSASRLVGLGSGLLILVLVVRAIMLSRVSEPAKPAGSPPDAANETDAFAMRVRYRRERDDYADAAGNLARLLLEKASGPDWRSRWRALPLPGSWLERRKLRQRIDRIARMAKGASRRRLQRPAFEKFYAEVKSLEKLLNISSKGSGPA